MNPAFFVRNLEQVSCPCCSGKLSAIGSRKRGFIDNLGKNIVLRIRRLHCKVCNSVHHELPDILVPYKRHCSESIESVLTPGQTLCVAADNSTIRRWRIWYAELRRHFLGCLNSIVISLSRQTAENTACSPRSRFQRVIDFVGNASGWLARIVRPVANTNNWIHTRSAFLSW